MHECSSQTDPVALQGVRRGARIDLHVDARDVMRGIFAVRQTVHAPHNGRVTLLFPQWLQGYHAPQSPLQALAGLRFAAQGRALTWRRDPVDPYAFQVQPPKDAQELEVEFQLLSPTCDAHGRVGATERQLNLQWNTVVLYPKGHRSDEIEVAAAITLPDGWHFATALKIERTSVPRVDFAPTALDVLADSPLFAGMYHKRHQLGASVAMNVFADEPGQIEIDAEARAQIENMVAEADKLFGARPFAQYDFLISLSDELGDLGVEHRRSSELVLPPDFFTDWKGTRARNDVLAHEYIHAWNGKFRRGKGACTASFDQPIRNDLLWVYEGLTQYWSHVLAVRSGLWDIQTFRDALALIAARCCNMKGRVWRPLLDTTDDPIISAREPLPWESWQRNQDYYTDGQLLWLEVDMLLRQNSDGARSLDDFGRAFFGMAMAEAPTRPYALEDVVEALNGILPWEWDAFFDRRLNQCQAVMPLDAIIGCGYQLVFLDRPSNFHRQTDKESGLTDLTFSGGLSVSPDGRIEEVIWDSPAFQAGLTVGSEILAIDDKVFSSEAFLQAFGAGKSIKLRLRKFKHVEDLEVAYGGGLRFPHLRRLEDRPALLDTIVKPHQ